MIVLYVLLAIILLISFILLCDISLVFVYKEHFDFKLKFFCFTIKTDKLVDLVSGSEENTEQKAEIDEKKMSLNKKKKSPSDVIDTVSYIVGLIGFILGKFAQYTRIVLARVKISIGTEDCSETALIYGAVSSALYTALEYFDSFLTVKKSYKNIGVVPDFTSESCRIDMKIILKIKIIHLLLIIISALPTIAEAKKGK